MAISYYKSHLLRTRRPEPEGILERFLLWYVERLADQGRERIVWKTVDDRQQVYLARYYVWPRQRDDTTRETNKRWRPSVLLHAICLPDADRHLHDHPWSFVSIMLKGGYTEERPHPTTGWPFTSLSWRDAGSVAVRMATDVHRVVQLTRQGGIVWTLLITGPRRREWGYLLGDGGWIRWDRYHGLTKDVADG